jgi:hypothetical protein
MVAVASGTVVPGTSTSNSNVPFSAMAESVSMALLFQTASKVAEVIVPEPNKTSPESVSQTCQLSPWPEAIAPSEYPRA